jgi:hypothetical protein
MLVPEVTLARNWYQWQRSDEDFLLSLRGKHAKTQWLLGDVEFKIAAREYIRETAAKKGPDRFTPTKFAAWIANIRSKSKGAGLMISAFITEIGGGILRDDVGRCGVEFLEYGNGNWWNSPKMLAQLKEAVEIRKRAYPFARVIWRFDNSSNHTAKADDALNAFHEHRSRW